MPGKKLFKSGGLLICLILLIATKDHSSRLLQVQSLGIQSNLMCSAIQAKAHISNEKVEVLIITAICCIIFSLCAKHFTKNFTITISLTILKDPIK